MSLHRFRVAPIAFVVVFRYRRLYVLYVCRNVATCVLLGMMEL